ncbi:MAG TPA: FHA domain-containing protein [Thermoanaerobaculia bacterium]|nr:FHA domain-containing protein [Thermoanaerobaculia bacterium]
MADKRCANGHFIDESWDLCPYCPVENVEPDIPIVRPTRAVPQPEPARAVAVPPAPPIRREVPQPLPAVVPAAIPPPTAPVSAQPAATAAAPPVAPVADRPSTPPMERTIAVPKMETGAAAKRYVVGWLVGLNGALRGESYAVRIGRNVLGRDKKSDIVVNDDQASAHHADLVFRPEERRFILMDHNSTNGTYVNESEIEPRRDLAGKDVIRIGSHRFLFMPLCHDGFYWDDEGALK